MGRKSRKKRERRDERRSRSPENVVAAPSSAQTGRIAQLQEEVNQLTGGEALFESSPEIPSDLQEEFLEDILAFESRDQGKRLFEGLREQGIELPRPETLDEEQCSRKVVEILTALFEVQVFLTGFDHLTACETYTTLWHETLWEANYIKKRTPGAITVIDVSHSLSRGEIMRFVDEIERSFTVH